MSGFFDFARMVLGWLSVPQSQTKGKWKSKGWVAIPNNATAWLASRTE